MNNNKPNICVRFDVWIESVFKQSFSFKYRFKLEPIFQNIKIYFKNIKLINFTASSNSFLCTLIN